MRKLLDRNPTWAIKLTQIGDGPSKNNLQQLAKDLGLAAQVHFMGFLPQAEAFPHLAAADVLALPIRSDPGPGVIPEGLGLGVPVIASAIGGIADLFQCTEAVRLVPVDDPQAFADALEEVLSNPGLAKRMATAGRKLFEEKFHLDHWVRDVQSWLECTVFMPILDKGL
jgi:glycosyltransferase involved in cell wall biosynthesis